MSRNEENEEEVPQLASYAVPYWADHLREVSADPACEELALNFVRSEVECKRYGYKTPVFSQCSSFDTSALWQAVYAHLLHWDWNDSV